MSKYRHDPAWIRARFNSVCPKCARTIKKDDKAYYYPLERKAYCETCGQDMAADFNSHAMDEDTFTNCSL